MMKITRELLESVKFRPFTKNDYFGFAGVMSPVPLIGEIEDEGIVVVIDGDFAELYFDDGCANFECVDTCDNIRELTYKTAAQLSAEAEIAKLEESIAKLKTLL
jgi:hypothetical protein